MRRHKLLSEIYKHADVLGVNKATLVFLIATMTDKALTKFHIEFMAKQSHTLGTCYCGNPIDSTNPDCVEHSLCQEHADDV